MAIKYVAEPFRIKSVEPIKILSEQERLEKIKAANYNMFALNSEDVYIDLLTDSGTGAMSIYQWAGVMLGDESYAGATSYRKLLASCQEVFAYQFFQPVHQGRAAEKVVMPIFLGTGKVAISNMHFDTTRAHVELTGARAIDCVIAEALDTSIYHPFKGNMDVSKLEEYLIEYGDKVGVVIMTITNNSAGGQPVSMANIKDVGELCKKYQIPYLIDAARFAENAYFIKCREAGYSAKSIKDITWEMFGYADIFTMSSKKDAIVNMGGLIGVKDNSEWFAKVQANCIAYEGFVTYGGLSGRDLEALAVGLLEGIDYDFLHYRVGQIQYLCAQLDDMGIAYQSPAGGHAIFIDAAKLFPYIPYDQYPGQALAIELYKEAGIRSCDIGSYMLGNDPDTDIQLKSDFEFTRLAIPRRVYTQAHFDVMAEALKNIANRATSVKGYKIVWQPKVLRHFTAKLVEVE